MATVPSEQIIGGNRRGYGQMHGVAGGFGRQAARGEKEASQFFGIRADGHARERGEHLQSPSDLFRIAPAGFRDDFLRGQTGEVRAALLPPIARDLLVGRREQITTGCRHQVADDARLDVNGFHLPDGGTLGRASWAGQELRSERRASKISSVVGEVLPVALLSRNRRSRASQACRLGEGALAARR